MNYWAVAARRGRFKNSLPGLFLPHSLAARSRQRRNEKKRHCLRLASVLILVFGPFLFSGG
jgi:hypothetical protein